jgi:Xaa-Pro aminopeptidase
MLEMEVAAELSKVALEAGPGLSFPSIVTVKGEVLHNQYYGNTLREGHMLLVDAGAESKMHYAGDMSRTFPVGAEFTDLQREIYQIGLDSQLAGIAALKPGTRYLDVHLTCAKVIVEGMKSLGIMKGDTDEAVQAGAHALVFQCGTGHMMGLDVHDMENLGEQYVGYDDKLQKSTQFGLCYLRLGKELKPGYVLTVEPGIYFIPTLIDKWKSEKMHSQFINYDEVEKFRNFGGLRAEDDFVITEDGARLLGPKVPKEVDEIEKVRKAALS